MRITETGIVTTAGEQAFDVIIWATGFDAVTGALTRMGVVGVDGVRLAEFWSDGPRTYLGVQSRSSRTSSSSVGRTSPSPTCPEAPRSRSSSSPG